MHPTKLSLKHVCRNIFDSKEIFFSDVMPESACSNKQGGEKHGLGTIKLAANNKHRLTTITCFLFETLQTFALKFHYVYSMDSFFLKNNNN